MLHFLGFGYISKSCTLNFIKNKSGDGVKNNELLAFGRDHFKHQVCHQVFLEYAYNFENVMSVVTKSQIFCKRAITRSVFGLCNSLESYLIYPYIILMAKLMSKEGK